MILICIVNKRVIERWRNLEWALQPVWQEISDTGKWKRWNDVWRREARFIDFVTYLQEEFQVHCCLEIALRKGRYGFKEGERLYYIDRNGHPLAWVFIINFPIVLDAPIEWGGEQASEYL